MAQCDKLKEAKWGESCVPLALCTSVLLLEAIEHILGIILAVTYVCLMSTSGDARVLPCKRPTIQEESEGVRVNGTVRVQEVRMQHNHEPLWWPECLIIVIHFGVLVQSVAACDRSTEAGTRVTRRRCQA